MATTNDLKQFLNRVEAFYKPVNPEKKTGIGHEIEHIKGVVHRANEICDLLSSSNKVPSLSIDRGISTTVAALHDIGNVINRKHHNHLGYGIIKGDLSIEDVLSVPMSVCIDDDSKSTFLTKENVEHIVDYCKNKDDSSLFNDDLSKALSAIEINALKQAFQIKVVFELGYNGITPDKYPNYMEKYNLPPAYSEAVAKFVFGKDNDERAKYKDINVSAFSELRDLTKGLQEIYPAGCTELDTIAKAIQDHNIDFTYSKEQESIVRYESRNLYGMIVADADKDNCPETFAIRTMQFAINKWAAENPYFNGVQIDHCLSHVMHQANERFRDNFTDSNPSKITPLFDDTFFYKEIKDIKIATEISGVEDPAANGKQIFVVPESSSPVMPYKDSGKMYVLSHDAGTDVYSQIDKHFGIDSVLGLRSDFFKKMRSWADPDNEKKTMKTMHKIYKVLEKAPSVEAAVDVYEKKYWSKQSHHRVKDNSFSAVIDSSIPDGDIHIKQIPKSMKDDLVSDMEEFSKKREQQVLKYQWQGEEREVKVAKDLDTPAMKEGESLILNFPDDDLHR